MAKISKGSPSILAMMQKEKVFPVMERRLSLLQNGRGT